MKVDWTVIVSYVSYELLAIKLRERNEIK